MIHLQHVGEHSALVFTCLWFRYSRMKLFFADKLLEEWYETGIAPKKGRLLCHRDVMDGREVKGGDVMPKAASVRIIDHRDFLRSLI